MRQFTSLILIGSAFAVAGVVQPALAAPEQASSAPQPAPALTAQGSGAGSSQINASALKVSSAADTIVKNGKNCGKGSNGQNNGNCPASP